MRRTWSETCQSRRLPKLSSGFPPRRPRRSSASCRATTRADVIARLSVPDAAAILNAMPANQASGARRLLAYPPDSAGGLMITEFLSYRDDLKVGDVLDDLRANAQRYRSLDVQYAYVVADGDRLVGVLQLRDLLLSSLDRERCRPS